ncbi:DUF2834 domain-containing protein [Gemmobacter serpentinus]|uniref:DUF2834 domain-containing protein n=1 Tax=Gemmobacter serpentinus TaxID=2652247 RepID=UPI00124DA8B1|nr:DUF2834 domain-containing protein [Gemmobacter serpentinus]
MSVLRALYLALTLAGAAHGLHRLIEAGVPPLLDLLGPVTDWNLACAGAALVFWALAETWVRRNWLALLSLPATALLGLGCGLPLYLFLRSAPIR